MRPTGQSFWHCWLFMTSLLRLSSTAVAHTSYGFSERRLLLDDTFGTETQPQSPEDLIARSAMSGIRIAVPQGDPPMLPDGHPPSTNTGPAAIPDTCITYTDRYKKLNLPDNHFQLWNPNDNIPDADIVILMRIYHNMQWTDDLRLTIRALMSECFGAGLHFWLLHQDSADEGATNHDKPTSFDTDMPKEFQAISHTFSAKMLHDAYPLLHEYDQPHSREYLPLLMFMRRYHGYRFAWCLENDVRYTGADWGILFNSMLNLATASLNSTTNLPQKYSEQLSRVPPSYAKLPDLIGMGFAAPGAESKLTEENMPRDTQHWRFKNYHKLHPAQVYAVSRLYIDTIHQHSLSGSGAFFEDFLLTLAIEEKLNVVMMPYPEFGGPFLDCCIYDGLQYYTDWYLTDACRHAALIHPVKGLDESVWGKGKTRF